MPSAESCWPLPAARRIMVSNGQIQIKIETSPVTRGAVYPVPHNPKHQSVSRFTSFMTIGIVANCG